MRLATDKIQDGLGLFQDGEQALGRGRQARQVRLLHVRVRFAVRALKTLACRSTNDCNGMTLSPFPRQPSRQG